MKVQTTRPFDRDYARLPGEIKDRVDKQLALLLGNPRHPSLRLPAIAGLVLALVVSVPLGAAAQEREASAPNYELAARWMSSKIQKLVFDTSVAPHYAELSDRFWYEYETAQGKHWTLVDPARKAKAPLFDNAKMAAMLTRVTRIPYDSQHLPVSDLKWTKDDTAIRFMVEVPKDAKIVETRKTEEEVTEEKQKEQKEQEQKKEEEQKKQEGAPPDEIDPAPTRKRATSSMGFCVAESPMR